MDFHGRADVLTDEDVRVMAEGAGLEYEVVKTFAIVETGGAGGFLEDGRPRILFEAKPFHELTGGRWDKSYPNISSPIWNRALYKGGAAEYTRLEQAYLLDPQAALKSASWGSFQVMGFNHKLVGYDTVEEFVEAAKDSEDNHLGMFLNFCSKKNLFPALQAHNWEAVAAVYNGTGQVEYYAGKCRRVYADLTSNKSSDAPYRNLRIGMSGAQVQFLQRQLQRQGVDINVDGVFGRVTEIKVEQWQAAKGLQVDGIVGPGTWASLGVMV